MSTPCTISRLRSKLLLLAGMLAGLLAALPGVSLRAQVTMTPPNPPPAGPASAQELVRAAVVSELRAAKADHSNWQYRDQDNAPGKAQMLNAIETPQGELRRLVELNGHNLSPQADQSETQRIQKFVNDPEEQARARRDADHDNAQAERFLKMLPDAFLWTLVTQTADEATLRYTPNPEFKPPTMESRVLAAMEGEMVIARDGDRIKTLRGKLAHDVKFGYGFLGKMDQGGTFNVERREVAPNHWEITETHVHMGGHALLFKNISQNADEIKTGWKPSNDRTLAEAAKDLGAGR